VAGDYADPHGPAPPSELITLWRAFLATAARGTYAACYRGETLGLEPAGDAAYAALAA